MEFESAPSSVLWMWFWVFDIWGYISTTTYANTKLMDELIQTMADDWTKVFPKAKVLNQFHVKKFAGLNPDHLEDRVRFGKHLGMKKGLVEMLSDPTKAEMIEFWVNDLPPKAEEVRPPRARKS